MIKIPNKIPNKPVDKAPLTMKKPDLPTFPMTVKNGNSTVKIYRCKHGPYEEFKVGFYFQGKRKLETYSTFAKAHARAGDINETFNKGDLEALTLTPIERQEYAMAKELVRPLGVSLSAAVMNFAEAQKLLGPVPLLRAAQYYVQKNPTNLETKTTREAVEEFLQMKQARGITKHYLYGLSLFLKGRDIKTKLKTRDKSFCSAFQCPLSSIQGGDIVRFMDSQGIGAYSANQRRVLLLEFFNWAKKKKYLPRDWDEMEALEKRKVLDADIEIYTPSEVAALLSASKGAVRTVMAIAAFSGMRIAEVLRLDWAQVGFGGGKCIEVKGRTSKTRQRRLIPLTENLKAWIGPYMKPSGKVWTMKEESFYLVRLRQLRGVQGIKLKGNALRHSYISYRMAQTSDVAVVSLEAGNSAAIVFKYYRQLVPIEQAQEWFSVVPDDASDKITYLKTASVS